MCVHRSPAKSNLLSFAASGVIVSLALLVGVAVAIWVLTASLSWAAGPLETTGDVRWIVFASRQNVDEAIGLARRFGSDFGAPVVISTTNGWYAVAAGPVSVPDPVAMKKRLSESWPPADTFFTKGATFVQKVWVRPKSPVLASASSSVAAPHGAAAAGLEVRIETSRNRRVVLVRSGGQNVTSVVFNDDGTSDSTGASIVRLDSSSAFPQVVASHFSGGAHCCTLMEVLTFIDNRWQVVNVGEFDSDGPQIEDLNGDGAAELVGKDDSFLYAFASYADSYAPPKILRLVGDHVADVSSRSEFQGPMRQLLLAVQGLVTPDTWRDNGFLAGWVAHNALIGSGGEAWRRMLALYNRNSDWDLSVCAVATSGDAPCPEYAKRQRDFPTALRDLLAKNGYSLEGIATPSNGAARPSFDCRKARSPSEMAVCGSPRLAELDDILAAGYQFIKATQGLRAADAIGIPYWRAIGQCEGEPACIAQRQSAEISALAAAGAPVSLPAWALAPANAPQPQSNPPAAEARTQPNPSPKPDHEESSGTGFFVTTDGAMITNAHVIENCETIQVTPAEGPTGSARIVARDVRNDLALLGTGLSVKKVAAFRPSIRLGEEVEAFGYPLADVLAKSGNFTLGNVSALVGIGEDSRYLQISAPVQPGNSGGPLLDQNGNVVGVVSAKLNALKMMLATNGDIPQNVNFAIKASIVTNFMQANGVAYATGAASQPVQPADLADQAKAMSALIECR
jgi:S1-C subfamily serine protease